MGWALAGLLGAIPLVLLLKWWSEGYIEGAEFFGIAAMFVILFALLMGPIPLLGKAVVFILLAGSSVGLPYIVMGLSKRDAKKFEEEKEMAYRATVNANPNNVAARTELARTLYVQGRRSEAIEEMEKVVKLSPNSTETEQYTLKRWIQDRDALPNPTMICRWCREETPRDRPFCIYCDRPTSAAREVAGAIMEDMPGTIRTFLKLLPAVLIVAMIVPLLGTYLGKMLIFCMVVGAMVWFHSRIK